MAMSTDDPAINSDGTVNAGYNGWTNYYTWSVNLWINDDQATAEYWHDVATEIRNDPPANQVWTRSERVKFALVDCLKNEFQESMPEVEGVWADLLNTALENVNWYEIAEAMIDNLDPEESEEDASNKE